MEEGREGPPTPKGWLKKLTRGIIGSAKEAFKYFDTRPTKVPLEKIGPETVAKTILTQVGNPGQEKFGKGRWVFPFSVRNVLVNMGHVPLWVETDPFMEFPKEYLAIRQALQKLTDQGVLEMVELEEPDEYNQRIYYKVADEKLLREIAEKEAVKKT